MNESVQPVLQEMLEETRRQNRRLRGITVFLAVMVALSICAFAYLYYQVNTLAPEFKSLMQQTQTAMKQSQGVMEDMDTVLGQLDTITAQLARADLEGVVDKLNGIDLETLNGSIRSLYQIVEPLSRLFGGGRQ